MNLLLVLAAPTMLAFAAIVVRLTIDCVKGGR